MKINYILATLAVVAGISAAFTHHAHRNNLYPTWKFKTERVEKEKVRYISASHLADILYGKQQGVVLMDLRSEEEYEQYHIPSSILFNKSGLSSVPDQSDMVVLIGNEKDPLQENVSGIQGKIYILKGGIGEWYSLVLFPDFSQLQVRNKQQLEKIIGRSRFFGGNPENVQLLNISVRSNSFREGC